jgi:hypothetical protein
MTKTKGKEEGAWAVFLPSVVGKETQFVQQSSESP